MFYEKRVTFHEITLLAFVIFLLINLTNNRLFLIVLLSLIISTRKKLQAGRTKVVKVVNFEDEQQSKW